MFLEAALVKPLGSQERRKVGMQKGMKKRKKGERKKGKGREGRNENVKKRGRTAGLVTN